MFRYASMAVLLGLVFFPAARGQDTDEVKRLRDTVAVLEAKLKLAEKEVELLKREVEQLKGKQAAAKEGKKSLSDLLPAGTVMEGDFRMKSSDKASGKASGKAVVTIRKRNGNKFEGAWTVTLDGVERGPVEFEGEVSGGRITFRSVDSVNKSTMSGEVTGGSLELDWASNNNLRAKVVLKLPK